MNMSGKLHFEHAGDESISETFNYLGRGTRAATSSAITAK